MGADVDLNNLTLAALLTTTGAAVVAGFITGLVAVLKNLIPWIDAGNEPRAVAVLAALVVLLLAVSAVQGGSFTFGVPLILAVVLGWYGVTRLAMAIHDDVTQAPRSLTNQTS